MTKKPKKNQKAEKVIPLVKPDAAGIDIGATEVYVAVPADRDAEPVRSFATFTQDLYALANWLQQCRIKTIAMESTGVYWIPPYQILEDRGFEVYLVNARHVKNVPGGGRMSPTANGCNSCTRSACCGRHTDRRKKSTRSVLCCGTGRAWCRWQRRTCSTCRRRWIK
jgi:hypothetical protein